ncbi:MAG: hypothetical protein GX614_13550, partial [Sandaracinaceae bacterium]|nr:hypothetical protein [Sandaracinaceae bacterium]
MSRVVESGALLRGARALSEGPEALRAIREEVERKFAADGLPTLKTEAYRFTPASLFIESAKTEEAGSIPEA